MTAAARSALLTLKGLRPRNEDAVLETRLPDGQHLLAVADGMGGHRSGEVASALALEVLEREVRAGRSLEDAVRAANSAVHGESERNPERAGMGTTLAAVLRSGNAYRIANVGDSRAYRVDHAGITRLTLDHSFAAEAARAGGLSPQEIAASPWRHALTRSLGTEPSVEVDVFGPFEVAGPPHAIFLCTDGVHGAVPDEAVWRTLLAASAPFDALMSLAALAVHRGSDDNLSLALVDFGGLIGASFHPSPPLPAPRGEPPARRRRPGRTRRLLARLTSDESLFLLCAAAVMLWLFLNLAEL